MAEATSIRSERTTNDLTEVMSDQADRQMLIDSIQSQMDRGNPFVKLSPRILLKIQPTSVSPPIFSPQSVEQQMKSWSETPADLCKTLLWARLNAVEGKRDQTIVYLGESGSGKTGCFDASVTMLKQISPESDYLISRIDASQFILREFATSWTARNSSASANGQLLRFGFDFRGSIQSCAITPLMIVKSPITSTTEEGNFRVFQTLITGADVRYLKLLKLKRNYENYRSLPEISFNGGGGGELSRLDFLRLRDSLKLCGFEECESKSTFELLAALLKMGNVRVRHSVNFDGSTHKCLEPETDVQDVCQLLQCDVKTFTSCFLEPIKHQTNDDSMEPRESAESKLSQFGLILYNRLFLWIVAKLNESMKSSSPGAKLKFLNLLDFYGFVNLPDNRLEQLIVNYTNELLMDLWHQDCLVDDQHLMMTQGLSWKQLEAEISGDSLKSLDIRLKTVIDGHNCLTNLGHRCGIPVASATDLSADCHFILAHFGQKVSYKLDGWCSSSLGFIRNLVANCGHPLIRLLFPHNNSEDFVFGEVKRKLWDQFKVPLNSVVEMLEKSKRHYVFCISRSEVFRDAVDISRQITAARLLPMFTVGKMGFVISRSYARFYQRYRMMCMSTWPVWSGNFRQGSVVIVRSQLLNPHHYAYGKTMLMFRCEDPIMVLEQRRNRALHRLARIIQRSFRSYRLRRLAKCQTTISASYKAFKLRKTFRTQKSSAVIIQSYFRGWRMRSKLRIAKKVRAAHRIVSFIRHRMAFVYLSALAIALPSASPIAMQWPRNNNLFCKAADIQIRLLYHRWRCRKYRATIDQQTYFRLREKLAASIIFKGKKLGYKKSVCHPFMGDYIKLRINHKWMRTAHELKDDYVVFADAATKIKVSTGKVSPVLVVVTTQSFIVLDPRSARLKYRTSVKDILKISTSPFADNVCILHTLPNCLSRNRSDFVFECRHIVEVVAKVFLVIQNVTGKSPIIDVSSRIWLESEEEPIEIVFKSADEESLHQTTGCFSSPGSSLRFSVSTPLPKTLTQDVTSLDSAEPVATTVGGDKSHLANNHNTQVSPSNSGTLMQKCKFIRKGSRVEVRV